MSDRVRIRTEREQDGVVAIVMPLDPSVAGREAELRLVQRAKVKRSNPVHKERTLLARKFALSSGPNRIELGNRLDEVFAYRGEALDLELKIELEIDDGFFFDTEVEHDLSTWGRLPARAAPPLPHKQVHSPADRFNFFANLRAIPAGARLVVLWLLLLGGPVLVPGVGAQGGRPEALAGLGGARPGQLLPAVSREVLRAGPEVAAVRAAAERLRDAVAHLA